MSIIRFVLSAIWFFASFQKWKSPQSTFEVQRSMGVPKELRGRTHKSIATLEAITGLLYIQRSKGAIGLARSLGVMQLSVYSAVMIWLTRKGEEIDCGCFGTIGPRKVGQAAVLRNLALLVTSIGEGRALFSIPQAVNRLRSFGPLKVSLVVLNVALIVFSLILLRWYGALVNQRSGGSSASGPGFTIGLGEAIRGFELISGEGNKKSSIDLSREFGGVTILFVTDSCNHCESIKRDLNRASLEQISKRVPIIVVNFESQIATLSDGDYTFTEWMYPEDYGVRQLPLLIQLDSEHRLDAEPSIGEVRTQATIDHLKL